jgi:hypothetical protein
MSEDRRNRTDGQSGRDPHDNVVEPSPETDNPVNRRSPAEAGWRAAISPASPSARPGRGPWPTGKGLVGMGIAVLIGLAVLFLLLI